MDNTFVSSLFLKLLFISSACSLSACVTQSYENNTPVVQIQANRDEMATTRISLGLGYLKMGNMEQAKLNLEKAKNFSPELVQVYTAFAHYYATVGETELTEQSFQKALSLKRDDADTLNNYGVFLCRQGKLAQAKEQLLKAIAVPSYILVAQTYENLSSCYLQANNFINAEKYLRKAISHSPNRTNTLLQMVRLKYAMGKYSQAKDFQLKFEKNARRFTSESLALTYKLYSKLGQRKAAKGYASMLIKMYPQSWQSQQYLVNKLANIEADNLAKRYRLTLRNSASNPAIISSVKRVVKLSPIKQKTVHSDDKQSITSTQVLAKKTQPSAKVAPKGISRLSTKTGAIPVSTTSVPFIAGNKDDSSLNAKTIAATKPELKQQDMRRVDVIEPTSTVPVAAKRDAPLPKENDTLAMLPDRAASTIETQDKTAKASLKKLSDDKRGQGVVSAVDASHFNELTNQALSRENKLAFHKVSKGETLYAISKKYDVNIKTLIKWNDLSPKKKLHIGEQLYVVDPKTVTKIND